MSMNYGMEITVIAENNPQTIRKITEAVCKVWDIDDVVQKSLLTENGEIEYLLCGFDVLGADETDEMFFDKVRQAIWDSVGFVQINLVATYLGDLPTTEYLTRDGDYDRLMNSGGNQ
jgi:hypothetical protein